MGSLLGASFLNLGLEARKCSDLSSSLPSRHAYCTITPQARQIKRGPAGSYGKSGGPIEVTPYPFMQISVQTSCKCPQLSQVEGSGAVSTCQPS